MVSMATLASGVGCVALVWRVTVADPGWVLLSALVPALALGLVFVWMFGAMLRLPTSLVAVGDSRTRIRFGGFTDLTVANANIVGARIVKHSWWGGLGVRGNLGGTVALTAAFGDVAELEFSSPVRVWAIPRLLPLSARCLRVGVRNPARLVERFDREQR